MSYKIAVASSDGKHIDETFGAAKSFIIYEVIDGAYKKLEERALIEEGIDKAETTLTADYNSAGGGGSEGSCGTGGACGDNSGCRTGTGGGCKDSNGCGTSGESSAKVELVSDCRCIVCKKIGFHIQKQLERKAISAFDVSCSVEDALEKISSYFNRMDKHEPFRREI